MRKTLIGLMAGAALMGATIIAVVPQAQADSTPTLGIAHPPGLQWATGLGTIQPSSFSLASTASSTVQKVTWDSWGGSQAIGHGLEANGASNPLETITVTAFDLGPCGGQVVYRQLKRSGAGGEGPGTINDLCH